VTTIEYDAFFYCRSLTDVTVEWEDPFFIAYIASTAFNGVPLSSCTLHVPAGTKALYQAAAIWEEFGNILEDAEGRK
jgi:hypothetical protein